jgi:D-alanyl-D-alanine carboxypeptidase
LDEAVRDALEDARGDHDLGLSAAVLVPGHAIWAGVAGIAGPDTPVTVNTLFDVGSVAKTFEAALVLALAEEGILGLDDPVSKWLPPLQHVDGSVTVRELLNHTSGVFNVFEHPEFPWVGADVDYARAWRLEEVFSRFVLGPYGPPGTVQHYASTNYLLVTAVVEKATGEPVPAVIRDRFLRPLGFTHTHMTMGAWPPNPFSVAHPMVDVDEDGILDDLMGRPRTWIASLTHPVLFSTPMDLVRWLSALFHDRTVLSAASLEAMLALPDPPSLDPEGGRYGLGIVDFSEVLGVRVIGHAGSSLGYSAAALYFPELDTALAWSVNTGESPRELADAVMSGAWRRLSSLILGNLAPGAG